LKFFEKQQRSASPRYFCGRAARHHRDVYRRVFLAALVLEKNRTEIKFSGVE